METKIKKINFKEIFKFKIHHIKQEAEEEVEIEKADIKFRPNYNNIFLHHRILIKIYNLNFAKINTLIILY